jgi:hypothetical protein
VQPVSLATIMDTQDSRIFFNRPLPMVLIYFLAWINEIRVNEQNLFLRVQISRPDVTVNTMEDGILQI